MIFYVYDILPVLSKATSSSVIVSATMDYGSFLFFMGLLIWGGYTIIRNSYNPWLKYNKEEAEQQKEERLKIYSKLPKLLQRFFKV